MDNKFYILQKIMTKLKNFIIILAVFLIPFITFWQELIWDTDKNDVSIQTTETNNIESIDTNNTIDDDTALDSYIANDEESELKEVWDDNGLWNLHFGFCNQWIDNISTSLNAAVSQWEENNVCFVISNDSNQDITIDLEYPTLVQDQFWSDACSIDNSFENFITNIDEVRTLTIPAGNYLIKELKLSFPIWIDWNQWWCITYKIPDNNDEWPTGWFVVKTVIRKWYMMKFFVWAIDDIKNELIISNTQATLNANKDLILSFNLENKWNLEDAIEIHGTVSNIFWYSKEFTIEWWKLLPERNLNISWNLGPIPSYWWLFNINFTTISTPYFEYDISNSSIDPSVLEPKEFTASTTFFQMPWLVVIIVIILILLIISIFRKPKEKVVYVNTPQQPMPNNGYWYQQPQQYQQPVQPQQYQNPGQQNQNQ